MTVYIHIGGQALGLADFFIRQHTNPLSLFLV
ncbi:hypothetical protein EV294_110164 [Paenibacillus sp. BK033]|nr:hypothetical protein EV294_110164 [Paenibacillus sp. BK033]